MRAAFVIVVVVAGVLGACTVEQAGTKEPAPAEKCASLLAGDWKISDGLRKITQAGAACDALPAIPKETTASLSGSTWTETNASGATFVYSATITASNEDACKLSVENSTDSGGATVVTARKFLLESGSPGLVGDTSITIAKDAQSCTATYGTVARR